MLSYPTTLDEEKVKILKEAGCYFIQVGIQSLNPDNRKNILKRYETNEDVANCIRWAKEYDCGISVDYIFFPWEQNEEDQLRASWFFHENRPSRLAIFYLSYLPGTAIVDYALKNGYITNESMEDIETGANAYYHAGGEYAKRGAMRFFKQFYNLFMLLLILPERWGGSLIRNRVYRFLHYLPSSLLHITKEIVMPRFSKKYRISPFIVRYFKYYFRNIGNFILGKFE